MTRLKLLSCEYNATSFLIHPSTAPDIIANKSVYVAIVKFTHAKGLDVYNLLYSNALNQFEALNIFQYWQAVDSPIDSIFDDLSLLNDTE